MKILTFVLFSLMLISCSSENQTTDTSLQDDPVVVENTPEQITPSGEVLEEEEEEKLECHEAIGCPHHCMSRYDYSFKHSDPDTWGDESCPRGNNKPECDYYELYRDFRDQVDQCLSLSPEEAVLFQFDIKDDDIFRKSCKYFNFPCN